MSYINTALVHQKKGEQNFYLKMDCYQTTGSFKIRGMSVLCTHYLSQGITHVVSSSGGNAGYSCAYAAQKLGMRCTVVVPQKTPEHVRARIRSVGAEVIAHGKVWDEADQLARQIVADENAGYVSPFEHPKLWEGHKSMILESIHQMHGVRPDAVVLSVGGGGMLCGVAAGMEEVAWGDIPIIAVETEGAASMAAALKANKLVSIDAINTIASSLGAKCVSPTAFEWSKKRPIHSLICSDAQVVDAVYQFADQQRCLVEPACGATLSALYHEHEGMRPYKNILLIVCGGIGIDFAQLNRWRKEYPLS